MTSLLQFLVVLGRILIGGLIVARSFLLGLFPHFRLACRLSLMPALQDGVPGHLRAKMCLEIGL